MKTRVTISFDGYEKMLAVLNETLPKVNEIVKNRFELQDDMVMEGKVLLDYNLKPQDILEIIPEEDLKMFIESRE